MIRRVKNFFIFWISRIAIFFAARIPATIVSGAGAIIGRAALLLARHERGVADRQLQYAFPRLTKRRRTLLLQGVAVTLGRNTLEACTLLKKRAPLPEVCFPASSRSVLDAALSKQRGVVFITGHLGNWEVMAAWLAEQGYPIHTIVRQSYDRRFTRLIDAARRERGVGTIFRGEKGAAAAMLRVLRAGGVLGFLIDQDTDVPSVFVPFFGRLAKTPVGPAFFAARVRAPVVMGTIHRRLDGRHQIDIEACPLPKDAVKATASFTALLESKIRRHPTQWVWFHNRWKTMPESTPR